MSVKKDTYKYKLKQGKRVVYIGHTHDLQRREIEHKKEYPESRIKKVGRRTTQSEARRWESKQLEKARFEPKELRSLSATTRHNLVKYKNRILKHID